MLFYLVVIPQFSSNSDTMILSLILLSLIQNAMKASSLVFYSADGEDSNIGSSEVDLASHNAAQFVMMLLKKL